MSGGQVTADLVHYHTPGNMGILANTLRPASNGVFLATTAATAAASSKAANISVGSLERTPEPEGWPEPMMRARRSLPLPVRSPPPDGSEPAAWVDKATSADRQSLNMGQVTATLLHYNVPKIAIADPAMESSRFEARTAMDMTPEPEERPGPMMRLGHSLPLPVRSPPPEAWEAASTAEETVALPSNPSNSEVTWRAFVRGDTAPPTGYTTKETNNQFYRPGAAHLLLPIRTPEPEVSSETSNKLQVSQTVSPHFVFSPTRPGEEVFSL
jgi:hypothetical protein